MLSPEEIRDKIHRKKPEKVLKKKTRDLSLTLPNNESDATKDLLPIVEDFLKEYTTQNIQESEIDNLIKSKNQVPDEIFLWALSRHNFNAKSAYMYLYPNASETSAETGASRKLSKLKKTKLWASMMSMVMDSWKDVLTQKLDYKAKMRAVEYYFDRYLGKPIEQIDANVSGGIIHLGLPVSQFIKPKKLEGEFNDIENEEK